jgi:hypothetical protein
MDVTQWSPVVIGAALTAGGAMIAAVAGLLGTLLGARITSGATRHAAEENRRTQIVLAREAARREWRQRQVESLLTIASKRTALYAELVFCGPTKSA